jgi:hypothetical protein
MARNSTRAFRSEPFDSARRRAGVDVSADSRRALASLTVASMLVVALVVGVVSLIEAVFSNPVSRLVQRSPAQPEPQGWRASARQPLLLSTACMQFEPASCASD